MLDMPSLIHESLRRVGSSPASNLMLLKLSGSIKFVNSTHLWNAKALTQGFSETWPSRLFRHICKSLDVAAMPAADCSISETRDKSLFHHRRILRSVCRLSDRQEQTRLGVVQAHRLTWQEKAGAQSNTLLNTLAARVDLSLFGGSFDPRGMYR
jgi:hypothetical protein